MNDMQQLTGDDRDCFDVSRNSVSRAIRRPGEAMDM